MGVVTDPSLVPWWLVWMGLMLAVSGAVLAMHGFGQRRPSKVADVGGFIVVVGVVLMLATTLANGVGMLASWLHARTDEVHVHYTSPDR